MENLQVTFIVLVFLYQIYYIDGLKIYPDVTELVIGKETKLTLNCTDDEPVKWYYSQEGITPTIGNRKTENWTENGTNFNSLTISPAYYLDTGYYICRAVNDTRKKARIYVYVFDEDNVIASDDLTIHAPMYERIIIPCKPTSPNVSVSLTKHNVEVESIVKYDPKLGYVIFTDPSIDVTHFFCLDFINQQEVRFTVQVYPPYNDSSSPFIEASDSNANYPIFEKQTAVLNCSIIASTNVGITSLEWEFPQNILEKILVENTAEIRHENFFTYYRMLRIYNLTKHDEGNYTCKTIDGNVNTKSFTHFLQAEESNAAFLNITVPEESRIVIVESEWDSNVEFTAIIESFPKHTFAWYNPHGYNMNKACLYIRCNVLAVDDSRIKLKLDKVKIQDMGIYQLKVRNAFLTKTVNFSLIVKAKPVVDIDRFYIKLFDINTIHDCECLISGYPVPQITWSAKICEKYPNCGNSTFQKILPSLHEEKPHETYQLLSVLHFKSNHSMIVQCEANNSLGFSSTSFPYLVTDYGNNVTMVTRNNSAPITVGDDVEIRCSVSKYYYESNFKWTYSKSPRQTVQIFLRDNATLFAEKIHIQNSTTNFSYLSTLIIKNVQKNHTGKYYCSAALSYTLKPSETFFPIGSLDLTVIDPKPPITAHSTMQNGPSAGTPDNNIMIGIVILLSASLIGIAILYPIRRLYREKKKLQKALEELGLEDRRGSTTTTLDPDLEISKQTFLISYNKKYDFPIQKLQLGGVLGSGAFGVVRKALAEGIQVKGVKTPVAVKMAKRNNNLSLQALTSEMKIMIYLGNHINVVQLLGACIKGLEKGELLIIVDFCKYGNLRDFLSKRRSQFVNQIDENDEIDPSIATANCYENTSWIGEPEPKKKTAEEDPTNDSIELQQMETADNFPMSINTTSLICWSFQLAQGMEFLASRKVLHGDLAARNVLLAADGIVKVSDFGFAKNMYFDENYQSSKTLLPIKWLSIEALREKIFSSQSDVWAFGVTIWEFFSLAVTPYPNIKNEELYDKLVSGYRMEKPQFATSKIYELMMNCWEQQPQNRPSFTELSEILGSLLENPVQSQNAESTNNIETEV